MTRNKWNGPGTSYSPQRHGTDGLLLPQRPCLLRLPTPPQMGSPAGNKHSIHEPVWHTYPNHNSKTYRTYHVAETGLKLSPPASASQVLGLQEHATMSSSDLICKGLAALLPWETIPGEQSSFSKNSTLSKVQVI